MLSSIPVGRRVSDALYLAPGVSSSGTAAARTRRSPAAAGLENQYVVDGANVTNTGYGGLGSYSIVFGSLGNATPFDFIKEVQVKTGGYEAEFGQATGGVVNVVTKSGSNDVPRLAVRLRAPSKLEGDWTQFQAANGTVNTITQVNDAGAEGGGPIVKNHLFFFGAIDPSWQQRRSNAAAGFPLASLGDVDRDRRHGFLRGEGHVAAEQLAPHRRVVLRRSVARRPRPAAHVGAARRQHVGVQHARLRRPSADRPLRRRARRATACSKASSRGRSTTINELPSVNTWRVTDPTVTPNADHGRHRVLRAGQPEPEQAVHGQGHEHLRRPPAQVRRRVRRRDYNQINQRTGPTFTAPDGRQTATGATITVLPDVTFGKIYRVTRANFNNGHDTTQKYIDFFVQDSWKVGNRLTINPGIRYEQEKLGGTIITDFQLKNNWAPRIGAAYDATGDGKTKVYGNYGVFYARVPNDLAARALSADDGFTRADYFDAGLTRSIPNGTVTPDHGHRGGDDDALHPRRASAPTRSIRTPS